MYSKAAHSLIPVAMFINGNNLNSSISFFYIFGTVLGLKESGDFP